MELKRPGILLLNLLIMVGYSVLFIAIAALTGTEVIAWHWGILLIHLVALLLIGLVRVFGAETKKEGKQYLLAFLLVAIIGHGLCFFGGLLNFNVH